MRRLLALGSALALAGCVPAERGRVMEQRLDRLEEEAELTGRQLEEQRELIRDRVAKVDAKIAEVQKKLDELNLTARRSGADVVARQDELERSLTQLRGKLEEEQHRLVTLDQHLQQVRQDVDARFAALKGAGALDQFEARRKLEALKRPADPQAFLALAKQQDEAGEKAVARELYDELVKRWPRDPAAAEAQYRLGELSAAENRHREAILAFGKVAQEFPRSERAPDAMLKTGDSLAAIGMRAEAVGVLRELQAKYPKSPAARTAAARIDELEPPPPKPAAGPKKAGGPRKKS